MRNARPASPAPLPSGISSYSWVYLILQLTFLQVGPFAQDEHLSFHVCLRAKCGSVCVYVWVAPESHRGRWEAGGLL